MKQLPTFLCALFAFTAQAQLVLNPDLRAFHPMNGDWWNAEGEADDHALFANATFGNDAQNVAGNAGSFSGSTRVNMNRGLVGSSTSNFSIEFWFKSSATASSVFYWEGALNQQSVWIRMEPANNRIVTSIGPPALFNNTPSVGAFNDGIWHHFALTGSAASVATIYIDGVLNATNTAAWSTAATTNFTRLGCKEDLTQYLNGSLDDLRVWGRALTAAEVAASYNAPRITIAASGSTTLCAGSSSSLALTLSSGAFPAGNTYYAQLSGPDGSFEYPRTIGTLSGTGAGSITLNIPNDVTTSTGYRVRVLASGIPVASQNTVAVTITNANSFPGYDILSGLRIHYPFDGNVNDATGNGFNGTAAGGLTYGADHLGTANGAAVFNGSSTRVSVGDRWPTRKIGGTNLPVSLSVWIKQVSTPSSFGYIFSLYNGNSANGLFLGTDNGGNVRFRVNNAQVVQAPISNGAWTLVTAVYTGSQVRMYVNGALVNSVASTGTVQNLVPAEMGWEPLMGLAYFNGSMDDFRFYDRALSVEEVGMLYRDGSLAVNNSPLCNGGTVQLGGPTFAGLSYDWSGPDAFTSSIEDPTIAPFNSLTDVGTYALTLTLNGCTGAPNNTVVTASVASPGVADANVCAGETFLLAATGGGPGLTYNWFADEQATMLLAADTDQYGGTASVTTTYYVLLDDGGGCTSATTPATVFVTQPPVVNLGPDAQICQGGSLLLDATTPGASYLWDNGSTTPTRTVTASGTYSVTVTLGGCSAQDAIGVQVLPNPVVEYIETQTQLCATDAAITLTPGTPAGGTYSGIGVAGNSFDPAIGTGSYAITYTYTDANGCTASDMSVIEVSICTGVAITERTVASAFPNPASDRLQVTGMAVPVNSLRIVDAMGRECAVPWTRNAGGALLDTRVLADGAYTMILLTGDNRHALRFVVRR